MRAELPRAWDSQHPGSVREVWEETIERDNDRIDPEAQPEGGGPALMPMPDHGSSDVPDLFGDAALVRNRGQAGQEKPAAERRGPARLNLPNGCAQRGAAAKAALNAAYPNASVEEKIIFDFVGNEMVLAHSLEDSAAQLVAQLGMFIDNPKLLLLVTKSLKDVMALHSALSRRVEGGLAAAANLRAQQAFIRSHEGRRER